MCSGNECFQSLKSLFVASCCFEYFAMVIPFRLDIWEIDITFRKKNFHKKKAIYFVWVSKKYKYGKLMRCGTGYGFTTRRRMYKLSQNNVPMSHKKFLERFLSCCAVFFLKSGTFLGDAGTFPFGTPDMKH